MNYPETLFITLSFLPLGIPAIWAFLATGAPPAKPLLWFNNRGAVIGVATILAIVASLLITICIYELGNCIGGGMGSPTCENISNELGHSLVGFQYFFAFYLILIGLPALVCYVIAEFITRIRMK